MEYEIGKKFEEIEAYHQATIMFLQQIKEKLGIKDEEKKA